MSDDNKRVALILVQGDNHGNALEIILSDASHYSEWINGEGADIGIHRAHDADNVVGARLPFYCGKLTIIVDGFVEVEVIREGEVER